MSVSHNGEGDYDDDEDRRLRLQWGFKVEAATAADEVPKASRREHAAALAATASLGDHVGLLRAAALAGKADAVALQRTAAAAESARAAQVNGLARSRDLVKRETWRDLSRCLGRRTHASSSRVTPNPHPLPHPPLRSFPLPCYHRCRSFKRRTSSSCSGAWRKRRKRVGR
jgi:hypothetical protein